MIVIVAFGTGWPTALITDIYSAPPLARLSRPFGTMFVSNGITIPVRMFFMYTFTCL